MQHALDTTMGCECMHVVRGAPSQRHGSCGAGKHMYALGPAEFTRINNEHQHRTLDDVILIMLLDRRKSKAQFRTCQADSAQPLKTVNYVLT